MTTSFTPVSAAPRPHPHPARPDPLDPVDRPWIRAGTGALGILAVIAVGLIITGGSGGVGDLDLAVVETASAAHDPALDGAALGLDWLLSPRVGVVLVILATLVVAGATRRVAVAVTFAGVVVAPWFAAEAVKVLVQRDRPDPSLLTDPLIIEPHSFSFPSGHTALAAGFALGAVLLARHARARGVVIAVGCVVTVLVGASRVWVGVHHPTDAVASMVLACAVVALVLPPWLLALDRLGRRRPGSSATRASLEGMTL